MFFGRRKGDTSQRRRKESVTARQAIPGLRILEKVGSGGFATVFKAQHVPSGNTVALKVLAPKFALDPKAIAHFLAEARLLTELDHPNIVKGFGFGKSKGLIHLVMEFVKGDSISALLEQWHGAIDPRVAIDVTAQVARALEYLHEKGVVHRDIKPANILYTPKGKVKVCDLGLASKIDPTIGSSQYAAVTAGTFGYMSPEQSRGKLKLDTRADIYSLGASLYHMVTGDPPRHDPADPEVRRRHVLEGIEKVQRTSAHLHKAVVYFMLRMMEQDPKKRYATPKELIGEIGEFLGGMRAFG